jgi:hypothetical protein
LMTPTGSAILSSVNDNSDLIQQLWLIQLLRL